MRKRKQRSGLQLALHSVQIPQMSEQLQHFSSFLAQLLRTLGKESHNGMDSGNVPKQRQIIPSYVFSHQMVTLEEEEFDNEAYRMAHFLNSHPLSEAISVISQWPIEMAVLVICLKLIYIWLNLSASSRD